MTSNIDFLKIFNNSEIGIYKTFEGNIKWTNIPFCNIFGYTSEELINYPAWKLAFPDIRDFTRELFINKVKKNDSTPEIVKCVKKNNEIIWVEIRVSYSDEDKCVYGLVLDVTRRITTEKELFEEKKRAQAWLMAVPDLIFHMNKEGVFLDYKADAKDLYYQNDTIIGKNCKDMLPSDLCSLIMQYIEASIASQTLQTFEYELNFPDENKKYFEARMIAINETEVISIIRDVSERKKSDLLLIEKNIELNKLIQELNSAKDRSELSDKLKTAFLCNISHEVRTPLNAILGFAQLLSSHNFEENKRLEYVNLIIKSGDQLLSIFNDIIEISKIESGQSSLFFTYFSINDLLTDLYDNYISFSEKKKIKLKVKKELSDETSTIYADQSKIRQIINNLLNNAFKFTQNGTIEFGYTIEGKNNIRFFVKDTGIGISKAKQSVIFDRFVQADVSTTRTYGGVGLGLSICKSFVEIMKGKIWIESDTGKGTTFFIELPIPIIDNQKIVSKKTVLEENMDFSGYTVLVAEDDDLNYNFIAQVLKSLDCRFLRAKNGKEAIDVLLKKTDVNLILMDIKMPVVDGFEATKTIKAKFPEINILAQTAYSFNQEKRQAIEAGCIDIITKPIDKNDLIYKIKKYIH